MIKIAGRPAKVGSNLYHNGFQAWGQITRYDPSGSAEFTIKTRKGERKLLVQKGGVINGRRQLFWHEPLELDLPQQNISAIQRIVDIVAKELQADEESGQQLDLPLEDE